MEGVSVLPVVHSAVTALTAMAVLSVASAVLVRERASTVSLLFMILTTAVAAWLASMSGLYIADGPDEALAWGRAAYIGIALIPPAILQFTVLLLRVRGPGLAFLAAFYWVSGIAFAIIFNATTAFITGVRHYPWGWYPMLSPAAGLFLLWFGGALASSLSLFLRETQSTISSRVRWRTQTFTLALGLGYLGMVDYLPSFGIEVYPAGFVAILAFLMLSARAAWRFRLVDLSPSFAADTILETMQGAVLLTDLDGRIRHANRSASHLLGWGTADLVTMSLADLSPSQKEIDDTIQTLERGRRLRDRLMIWNRRMGEPVDVAVSASLLRDSEGLPVGMVWTAADISLRRRMEEIEYQAWHDPLTGLANRAQFDEMLLLATSRRRADGHVLAVLFIDLDGFKEVNDVHGHATGDQVLRLVAARISGSLREKDLVARVGGDEFVVLIDLAAASDASLVAAKLIRAISKPYQLDATEVSLSASIGVAVEDEATQDARELMRAADEAMYTAKRLGKNRFHPDESELQRPRLIRG